MTPGARASAAILILDRILDGEPAEKALTNWGRASRFAGSGDRAAVRDLVFDALRRKRSAAARGGGMTGRGLILGLCREAGTDHIFDGAGHAPASPVATEAGRMPSPDEALDLPDWLLPDLRQSLGDALDPIAAALRHRAPVFLRVNLAKLDLAAAQSALLAEGIKTRPHPLAAGALEITENARKLQSSKSYLEGLVELQDVASQAVVEALPLHDGMRVLDHCAGGGGKSLAMAARAKLRLFAHDVNPHRMADLPARAARAGVKITRIDQPEAQAPYDLILVDAPCSGSGSWRRDPEGKWKITLQTLDNVIRTQAEILDRVVPMLKPGGILAYATCALLNQENTAQITGFLRRHSAWTCASQLALTPLDGGDGFFLAILHGR